MPEAKEFRTARQPKEREQTTHGRPVSQGQCKRAMQAREDRRSGLDQLNGKRLEIETALIAGKSPGTAAFRTVQVNVLKLVSVPSETVAVTVWVTALATKVSVPAMTRLRLEERRVLDTLVEGGVARSRSHALAWCVRLVAQRQDEWLKDLREALSGVEKVRGEGPTS